MFKRVKGQDLIFWGVLVGSLLAEGVIGKVLA